MPTRVPHISIPLSASGSHLLAKSMLPFRSSSRNCRHTKARYKEYPSNCKVSVPILTYFWETSQLLCTYPINRLLSWDESGSVLLNSTHVNIPRSSPSSLGGYSRKLDKPSHPPASASALQSCMVEGRKTARVRDTTGELSFHFRGSKAKLPYEPQR